MLKFNKAWTVLEVKLLGLYITNKLLRDKLGILNVNSNFLNKSQDPLYSRWRPWPWRTWWLCRRQGRTQHTGLGGSAATWTACSERRGSRSGSRIAAQHHSPWSGVWHGQQPGSPRAPHPARTTASRSAPAHTRGTIVYKVNNNV